MRLILCVDDDPFMLQLYAMSVPEGWRAELAASAEDAMPSVERASAIILDAGLPGMSGAEFLGWVRAQSDVPVLVVTGEESSERHAELRARGASEVRVKPVRPADLRSWLELNVR